VILAIAGIFLEPLDWIMTVGEIVDDPRNPFSYAGLIPFVPAGVGKGCKALKTGGKAFGAAGDGQHVFRVVDDAELSGIMNTGKFSVLPSSSTPTGLPGKFFWGSEDEAARFQQMWYGTGENSHIVRTTLTGEVAPKLFPHTDGIGTALWIDLKDLTAPIVHLR
jgi:hypothetical protein